MALIGLDLAGYGLFRSANLQKHRFRRDPAALVWGRRPDYITTANGNLLLVSGWWGMARHLNYLGDLVMGLSWCLPCRFAHPLPYFYILYSVAVLVHRERRDHAMCAAKYGPAWEAYCRRVPWRILPGVCIEVGAQTWPPLPQRWNRPGAAVAVLDRATRSRFLKWGPRHGPHSPTLGTAPAQPWRSSTVRLAHGSEVGAHDMAPHSSTLGTAPAQPWRSSDRATRSRALEVGAQTWPPTPQRSEPPRRSRDGPRPPGY